MLSGFNTNIRHRGTLFHVQTEDSGRKHPHIISHLYYGGTILASEKSGYAELLTGDSSPDQEIEAGVRTRMQNQHKGMLRRLTAGAFDQMITATLGPGILSDEGSAQADSPTESPAAEQAPAKQAAAPAGAEPTPAAAVASKRVSAKSKPGHEAANTPAAQVKAKEKFGDAVLSEKPLDEVVFDFLVENARKKPSSQ